jgi:hypothetical protein
MNRIDRFDKLNDYIMNRINIIKNIKDIEEGQTIK